MNKLKHFFTFAAIILFGNVIFAQSARYELSMENPNSHYFHVDFYLKDYKTDEVVVKMPVWAPGSYLVREFSKNVDLVTAFDEKGNQLNVIKKSKNAWTIKRGNAKEIKVSYDVYAFELTVRTSFLDMTHGFVSGTGVFMYTEETRNKEGQLKIIPHASFSKITTALPKVGEQLVNDSKAQTFKFSDYDYLVDCPIEIGNHEEFTFKAAGVNHTVAMYGWGNYDVDRLKVDMAKVVEASTDIFGQNPNKDYVFIIHNVTDGQGGLEHLNSTTLSVNRYTYQGDKYIGFLSLVAHEYFHLWNVKRIRAYELGPFNYDEEAYTSLLWVMEGFTSYYDELILLRAGFYTKEQYLNVLFGTINYVEGTAGNKVQPVAHSSLDAWIKSYRPNENSSNTQISYYSKGGIFAALFDAMIISKTKGEKCLDHFLRHLYDKYYVQLKRGFKEKEFQDELSNFIGEDLSQFFADYIFGTKTPNYNEIFSKVGLSVQNSGTNLPALGATLNQNGRELTVKNVRRGSSAELAGLSANDEIIGCNGIRTNQRDLERILASLEPNESVTLLVSRDNVLLELKVQMKAQEKPRYTYSMTGSTAVEKMRNYWLRTVL